MDEIKDAPSLVSWRRWQDSDLNGRTFRVCSTPGCTELAWSLKVTAIKRPTGAALIRKHAYCEEHTPDGVVN